MAVFRDDIRGIERVSETISTYLRRKAGVNLYGESVFRVVWSKNRVQQRGGKFNDWDKNIAARERGGMVRLKSGLIVPNGHNPIRSVIEVRTVLKYPALEPAWILERWVPADYYGSRAQWERRTVPGTNVQLLGQYPATGDYEMVSYFAGQGEPTVSWLANEIDLCEKARNEHKANTEQALLERENEYQAAYEQQCAKEQAETEAFYRDLLKPLDGSSLTAGVIRNQLAARAGITEHVGN